MRKFECIISIIPLLLLILSCEQGILETEIKVPSDQFIWISEWAVPFIDGKTGKMITETGDYDEYIIYDYQVDTLNNWPYPVLIILKPNYSGSAHVFIWRLPEKINEYEYKEIVVSWWARVFEPETLMTHFPQFHIVTDENTDPHAPDAIGFVSVCHIPTTPYSFLPKPEDDWYNQKIIFNYPDYDELKDGFYLTLIRPKNYVVMFGIKIYGITR